MRPGNERLNAATERASGNPRFARLGDVPRAIYDGGFDALAAQGRDAFGVEHGEEHVRYLAATRFI